MLKETGNSSGFEMPLAQVEYNLFYEFLFL